MAMFNSYVKLPEGSHPTIIGDSKQNVYINLSENFIKGTTIPFYGKIMLYNSLYIYIYHQTLVVADYPNTYGCGSKWKTDVGPQM